ncbi:MAG TPA: sigma-70 family RNA polymerase sigma factor [Thermoanaerobaculia bacterium]|jgi:RNA polymerase sigma-70 factor (ECF subfamily)
MTYDDFWKRYYRDLVAALIRYGRQPEDAEELASDALDATWRRLEKIRPERLWAYLLTAAQRAAINHHRDANAQKRDAGLTAPLDELNAKSHSRTPEDEAIARETVARIYAGVRDVMNELPEETRLYIVLRHRRFSYEQIARHLGVRIPAVQSRLYRATTRFEERLGPAPEGLTWIELAGELTDEH